jgi:hypothetical protein
LALAGTFPGFAAVAAGAVLGAGAVAGAVPGDVAGAEAGAEVGAVAGAVAGDVAAVVTGAAAGEDDPDSGTVAVVWADVAAAGAVAPLALADDVPDVHTVLVTRTPTPSTAPLSSVTRGVFSFMPGSTPSS